MAAVRPKPAKKGMPEPARRQPAWTGARASPTFSPGSTSPRLSNGPPPSSQGAFPPLGQTNGTRSQENPQERVLQSLSGLTGTTITLLTKTAQRYEGIIFSTNGEGDTNGVTLKDVKEITSPGAPLKDSLFIASTNIDSFTSGPADAKVPNGDSFRTDTDISGKGKGGRERELQAWQPSPDGTGPTPGQFGDDLTFGPGNAGNKSWDQFAANEQLYGVKTSFDEDAYTTKLDRSAADFEERERKAQKIANEIIRGATNNPHIAEERNLNVDDGGVNEEDKYGAVVRGTGAYVPPGARKTPLSPPASGAKSDIPKVAVNAPDGAIIPDKAGSPVPTAANTNKPPADPVPAFRDFVTNEKQRLTQKKQALVKSEMDKRMAELKKFSLTFKLNKPIPDDLVPILAKDEEKQKQIRDKASKDASSTQARTIGINSVLNPTPNATRLVVAHPATAKAAPDGRKAPAAASGVPKATLAPAKAPVTVKPSPDNAKGGKGSINMFIQAIPAFKGTKPRTSANATSANGNSSGSPSVTPRTEAPTSPTSAARLNVNASSFRPNPKANAFSPVTKARIVSPNPSVASASPKPKPAESHFMQGPTTPNPFFGARAIKKGTPVNIKDDFNPFKHNKVVEANQVAAIWPYSGKRYIQLFPPPPHNPPQQSPHMAPPGPPPMPPPPYEEDQAAARGYVYAPYPYAYPGQPMMPGMPPPGPPGAYMPGPYMQAMHYPPGMPPPNGQPEQSTIHSDVFPKYGSDATTASVHAPSTTWPVSSSTQWGRSASTHALDTHSIAHASVLSPKPSTYDLL
ncbi:hypothetical protein PILCRDRAFT_779165 [Piloderma croceum F 1598]|uniref:LsmAD domain-containing protein n=1 Tax=Piloderma croceum (strain F 1598) TaxID=765440 RepID=A0A0C3FLF9_PILCF|nr:hypothetical protein PILCRDRAFT_779165 [Piloderma croceum F 1598]